MQVTVASDVLQGDVLRLAVGELILGAGLVALVLHGFRSKTADRSTLYFGLAAFLYGLRLIVEMQLLQSALPFVPWSTFESCITLVVGLPFFLYFGSTIARAYAWFTRGVVGVAILVAMLGAVMLLRHAPLNGVWRVNGVLVVASFLGYAYIAIRPKTPIDREVQVLRIGMLVMGAFVLNQNLGEVGLARIGRNWEPFGILVLLCTFLYVSAARNLRTETSLIAIRNELEIACQIQAKLLPNLDRAIAGVEIRARYAPAGSVAGDFYDVLCGDRGLGILIADVSGHGVPAALSASMLKVALHAQAPHMTSPAEVLTGLNRTLCGTLGSQFITAAYVFVDTARRQLRYAGAGHPPILLWRSAANQVEDLEENGLFLGPFPHAQYAMRCSRFEPGDRCLLYTDGLVEAANANGEEFGAPRLRDFLSKGAGVSADSTCTALLDQVTAWSGGELDSQQDDITFVLVEFRP